MLLQIVILALLLAIVVALLIERSRIKRQQAWHAARERLRLAISNAPDMKVTRDYIYSLQRAVGSNIVSFATKRCSHCYAFLAPSAKYCHNCGVQVSIPVTKTCKACNTQMPAAALYCLGCGERMWLAGATIEGSRSTWYGIKDATVTSTARLKRAASTAITTNVKRNG